MNIKSLPVILFISAIAHVVYAQELVKIETYVCAPDPEIINDFKETYDYRKASNTPNPPTLTDAFICDIWQRIDKADMPFSKVTIKQVTAAFKVYLKKDWNDISGYRPRTHSCFIRSLTEEQRKTLAAEVVDYIIKKGVNDPVR